MKAIAAVSVLGGVAVGVWYLNYHAKPMNQYLSCKSGVEYLVKTYADKDGAYDGPPLPGCCGGYSVSAALKYGSNGVGCYNGDIGYVGPPIYGLNNDCCGSFYVTSPSPWRQLKR